MTVLQHRFVQTNHPRAYSDYRQKSTKIMGTVCFQILIYVICETGRSFQLLIRIFSSHLRIFNFLYVILPYFLFCSDPVICILLAHHYQFFSRNTWIFRTIRFSGQRTGRHYVWQWRLGSCRTELSVQTTSWHSIPTRHAWAYCYLYFCLSYLLWVLFFGQVHSCVASCFQIERRKQKISNFRHLKCSYQSH